MRRAFGAVMMRYDHGMPFGLMQTRIEPNSVELIDKELAGLCAIYFIGRIGRN